MPGQVGIVAFRLDKAVASTQPMCPDGRGIPRGALPSSGFRNCPEVRHIHIRHLAHRSHHVNQEGRALAKGRRYGSKVSYVYGPTECLQEQTLSVIPDSIPPLRVFPLPFAHFLIFARW